MSLYEWSAGKRSLERWHPIGTCSACIQNGDLACMVNPLYHNLHQLALPRPKINFNLGFIFFFFKVHSWISLSVLFRKSKHQIVDKKEQRFQFSSKL